MTSTRVRAASRFCLAGLLVIAVATGCLGGGPAKPRDLRDPCSLIADDVRQRLAPGAPRVPAEYLGDISGRKECQVDLESGSSSLRGDLLVSVAVDGVDMYDADWRSGQCAKLKAEPSAAGPGDQSCIVVKPWADGEARIDGLAWIGDDYEARVGYQLVEPHTFPAGAEQDLRNLLAAAVDTLPAS